MKLSWRKPKRAEDPVTSKGRGAHLIKANLLRGLGGSVRTGDMGPYVTDRSKDKPNTMQGTRR